jgi:hypothetical protein
MSAMMQDRIDVAFPPGSKDQGGTADQGCHK